MSIFRQRHIQFIKAFKSLRSTQNEQMHRLYVDFLSFLSEDKRFAFYARQALEKGNQSLYSTHHNYPIVVEIPYLTSYSSGNRNFRWQHTIGLFSPTYILRPRERDLHEIVLFPHEKYIPDDEVASYLKDQRDLYNHHSITKDYLLLRLDGSVTYVPEIVSSYFEYTLNKKHILHSFQYIGGHPASDTVIANIFNRHPYRPPVEPLDTPTFIKNSL